MSDCIPHECDGWKYAHAECGPAITYCKSDEDGYLWAGNFEYETMVNFCPFCGKKAEKKALSDEEYDRICEAEEE